MNKSLLIKSIKLCYKECPLDSILLVVVSLVLSTLPVVTLSFYQKFISTFSIEYHNIICSILLLIGYCILNFIQRSIFHFYHHYYLNYQSLLRFEKKIKIKFFSICSELNLEDYLSPEIVNETKRAQNASINIFRLYQIIVEMTIAIIGFFLIGSFVLYIHPTLIFFLFLSVVPSIADQIFKIIEKKFLLYQNTQKQKEEEVYLKFLTRSEHIKEIKILKCFDFIFSKWQSAYQVILEMERKSQTKILILSLFFHFIKWIGMIGAYWSITVLLIEQKIRLAEFSMIILAFSKITESFQQLCALFGNLSEFSIMVEPYFIFAEKLKKEKPKKERICEEHLAVQLKQVSFHYPNSSVWALKDISLTIQKGEFLSIVGENGAGKTTFSKILLGFFTPVKGEVSLLADWKKIAYIPQNFHCYCISIKENIFFGNSEEGNKVEQLLDAISLTDLKGKEESLYGLEFGGMELSGGQKQKIAILRAMVKKADLLIFDEPTSAIDPLQESFIYHTILELTKGKTTIMVSHRLALTRYSDRIVVLKQGEILESGDFQTLMEQNGEYARMWNAQAGLYQ